MIPMDNVLVTSRLGSRCGFVKIVVHQVRQREDFLRYREHAPLLRDFVYCPTGFAKVALKISAKLRYMVN